MTTEAARRPFVSGIVLAAGASTRMGRPKQLLPFAGRALLQHAVDAACEATLDEVILVLGHRSDEIRAALSLRHRVRVVVNRDYAAGQITSLQCGLGATGSGAAAAAVLLGDQPTLTAGEIDRVVDSFIATGATAARPVYPEAAGRPGHPVVLGRARWPEVARLRGDQGARTLFSAGAADVLEIPTRGAPPPDVDTPADFARLGAAGTRAKTARGAV